MSKKTLDLMWHSISGWRTLCKSCWIMSYEPLPIPEGRFTSFLSLNIWNVDVKYFSTQAPFHPHRQQYLGSEATLLHANNSKMVRIGNSHGINLIVVTVVWNGVEWRGVCMCLQSWFFRGAAWSQFEIELLFRQFRRADVNVFWVSRCSW